MVGPMVLSGLEEPLRQVSGRAYGPIRAGGTTAAGYWYGLWSYQGWRNHCGRLLVGPMVLSGLEEPLWQVSGRAYGPIRTGGTTEAERAMVLYHFFLPNLKNTWSVRAS